MVENQCITLEELKSMIDSESKIFTTEQGTNYNWYNRGKVVTTNGCFDLLHPGHLKILSEAKKQGDWLIVLIDTDNRVQELKGMSRPALDLTTRMQNLAALGCVDFVIPFNTNTEFVKLLQNIQPKVHVKGNEYRKLELIEESEVLKHGVLAFVKELPGYSTTNTILKIQSLTTKCCEVPCESGV